jgi:hypothetical protein
LLGNHVFGAVGRMPFTLVPNWLRSGEDWVLPRRIRALKHHGVLPGAEDTGTIHLEIFGEPNGNSQQYLLEIPLGISSRFS